MLNKQHQEDHEAIKTSPGQSSGKVSISQTLNILQSTKKSIIKKLKEYVTTPSIRGHQTKASDKKKKSQKSMQKAGSKSEVAGKSYTSEGKSCSKDIAQSAWTFHKVWLYLREARRKPLLAT